MKPHGLEALASVSAFLADRIAGAVPPELVGEVRAAVKVLRAVEDELGVLPGLLPQECRALVDLVREAADAVGEAPSGVLTDELDAAVTTRELLDVHRALRGRLGELLPRVQEQARRGPVDGAAARDVLTRAYAALGDGARTRERWQSVFTP